MSYDIDEDGNKFFYDVDLINEDNIKEQSIEFEVYFSGTIKINALNEQDALNKFEDLDFDDIFGAIKNKEVI